MEITWRNKKDKLLGFGIKKIAKRKKVALVLYDGLYQWPVAYFCSKKHAQAFIDLISTLIIPTPRTK